MKVIISMPMNGVDDQEVQNQMNSVKQQFIAAGHEVIDTMLDLKVDGYKNPALLYLGGSVRLMGDADAVYFAPGWDQARGCLIEHHICQLYGINILTEIPKPIEKILFDINKLEIGDTIIFFNGDSVVVESISKCPCGQCDVYYINSHMSTYYGSMEYIIKKEKETE